MSIFVPLVVVCHLLLALVFFSFFSRKGSYGPFISRPANKDGEYLQVLFCHFSTGGSKTCLSPMEPIS